MAEKNTNIVYDLQYVKGVGPVKAEALASEGIFTPDDLMKFFPRDYIDRTGIISLKSIAVKLRAEAGINKDSKAKSFIRPAEVTVVVKIIDKKESSYGKNKKMLKFLLSDGSDINAEIVFWAYTEYYNKAYELEEMITISGKAELNKFNRVTFHHPEIEKFHPEDEKLYRAGGILPVYR
ncbi:MAG: hypothetical protein PF588_01185, partial [Candidatus Kapabacteria bacterium]|nr:hypothetical protein [Candidatus Kapabacteria bacterium]